MLRSERKMPEKSIPMRSVDREASRIISQNKEVKLSEEILLQLRRAGLRLIP